MDFDSRQTIISYLLIFTPSLTEQQAASPEGRLAAWASWLARSSRASQSVSSSRAVTMRQQMLSDLEIGSHYDIEGVVNTTLNPTVVFKVKIDIRWNC
jgi:hypothetical protein